MSGWSSLRRACYSVLGIPFLNSITAALVLLRITSMQRLRWRKFRSQQNFGFAITKTIIQACKSFHEKLTLLPFVEGSIFQKSLNAFYVVHYLGLVLFLMVVRS